MILNRKLGIDGYIIIIIYSLSTITMYNELPNLLAGITYYIIYIINIIFFVLSISETVLLAYIFHSSSQMTTMLVVGQV